MSLIELEPGSTIRPRPPRDYRPFYAAMWGLVAIAIAYYFFFALPRNNKALLDLEREKFQASQAEKQKRAEKEAEKETAERKREEAAKFQKKFWFKACSDDANEAYWGFVKLNGKEVPEKPGTYEAPARIWDDAEKKKKAVLARLYPIERMCLSCN